MATIATAIRIARVTPAIGAVVEGVDFSRPLDAETVAEIRAAWLEHGVLFFRNQDISEAQLETVAGYFGKPVTEPSNASFGEDPDRPPVHSGDSGTFKRVAERWHADASWLEHPPTATALRMAQPPANGGGDTCWANVTLAYEELIAPIRQMLDQLHAVHWMAPSLAAMGVSAQNDDIAWTHPVVAVHPETGRKALYVSEGWTKCIADVPTAQSVHLLAMLYDHIRSPLYSMRWHWAEGDIAVWDNRAVQHFAVPDYESGRIIQRVVTEGWTPRGPGLAG
ncbi:MAG: TauD/TfdA dioxygenase family protein [Novosphingobium sp.]